MAPATSSDSRGPGRYSALEDESSPLTSEKPFESDSEYEENVPGRTSTEVAQYDRQILDEEEEREKLLTEQKQTGARGLRGLFGSNVEGNNHEPVETTRREKKRIKRAARRERRRRGIGEEAELMYEMEEGDRISSSASSRDSSESDKLRLGTIQGQKKSRRSRFCRRCFIHVGIVLLFLVLLFAAYRASRKSVSTEQVITFLSNGTSNFAPTTILISLDGFRADFLQRGLTPTLNAFIREGVSPRYMLPSFPSVTFPNHYTMVTGLYPEAHGVVGNTFWDPGLKDEFYYTDPAHSMDPKWWGGEPLWVTAEEQSVKSAIHMWPGSEAHIGSIEPAYVDKYNGTEALNRKVDRVLGLLDLPGPESLSAMVGQPRPQLIAAYVPNVDQDGHRYGPNSTEIRQTISDVDEMLHGLFEGLKERNLTRIVNVVVVSDHGMATTDAERLVQLEDLIDVDKIEHTDGWPLYGLRPKNPNELQQIYEDLHKKAENIPDIEVYLRDENMPERYHFSKNDRIAPLWIVPKTGWAIVTKEEFDVEEGLRNGDIYHPRGLHGYDHEHPLMRAIFIARGPAFPHQPGSRVKVFQNTEIYNIVCDSLGIEPKPNNGTLRLPLTTFGGHGDGKPDSETPDDPPKPNKQGEDTQTGPTHDDDLPEQKEEEDKDEPDSWWEWVAEKVQGAKSWAHDFFDKGSKHDGDGDGA